MAKKETGQEECRIEDLPEDIAGIILAMKREDDAKRETEPKDAKYPGDYNPTWRVLAYKLLEQDKRIKALLKPLEFQYAAGRPSLIIRLGSEVNGWIPKERHFDEVRRFVKASGLDKSRNVLLFHYAISCHELNA